MSAGGRVLDNHSNLHHSLYEAPSLYEAARGAPPLLCDFIKVRIDGALFMATDIGSWIVSCWAVRMERARVRTQLSWLTAVAYGRGYRFVRLEQMRTFIFLCAVPLVFRDESRG
jgi:hypothetical protein